MMPNDDRVSRYFAFVSRFAWIIAVIIATLVEIVAIAVTRDPVLNLLGAPITYGAILIAIKLGVRVGRLQFGLEPSRPHGSNGAPRASRRVAVAADGRPRVKQGRALHGPRSSSVIARLALGFIVGGMFGVGMRLFGVAHSWGEAIWLAVGLGGLIAVARTPMQYLGLVKRPRDAAPSSSHD